MELPPESELESRSLVRPRLIRCRGARVVAPALLRCGCDQSGDCRVEGSVRGEPPESASPDRGDRRRPRSIQRSPSRTSSPRFLGRASARSRSPNFPTRSEIKASVVVRSISYSMPAPSVAGRDQPSFLTSRGRMTHLQSLAERASARFALLTLSPCSSPLRRRFPRR